MGIFDGAVSSLIGGGLSLAGDIFGANSSAKSIEDQMKYQTYMSNTSHQREVQDLIKAGLNPILSAKYGGASTPPGASMQFPNFGSNAVNSAMAAKQRSTELKKAEQEIEESKAREKSTDEMAELYRIQQMFEPLKYASEIDLNDANSAYKTQESAKIVHEIANMQQLTAKLLAETTGKGYDNKIAKQMWKIRENSKFIPYSESYGPGAKALAGAGATLLAPAMLGRWLRGSSESINDAWQRHRRKWK